jgi:hypothetical protein
MRRATLVTVSDQTDTPSLSEERYSKLTSAELDEVMAKFYQRLADIAATWNR